jgi:hypothetical protein
MTFAVWCAMSLLESLTEQAITLPTVGKVSAYHRSIDPAETLAVAEDICVLDRGIELHSMTAPKDNFNERIAESCE